MCAQSSSLDAAGVDRSSIALESALTSGAYNLVLQGLVHRSPALPIVHVPADRTFAWSQESGEAMVGIVRDWWREVNRPDVQFILFHFTDNAHYCALLLDVAAWKAGPFVPSAAAAVAVAGAASPTAAAATAVAPTPALHSSSRRLPSRFTRTTAVSPPLLHIDTQRIRTVYCWRWEAPSTACSLPRGASHRRASSAVCKQHAFRCRRTTGRVAITSCIAGRSSSRASATLTLRPTPAQCLIT